MVVMLHYVMLPSLVSVMMRHVVFHSDQGIVRGVGESENAKGEAQREYR